MNKVYITVAILLAGLTGVAVSNAYHLAKPIKTTKEVVTEICDTSQRPKEDASLECLLAHFRAITARSKAKQQRQQELDTILQSLETQE